MQTCHSPEALAAYRHKPPHAPGREAVEAHVAACEACRDVVLLLGVSAGTEPAPLPEEVLVRLDGLKIHRTRWSWGVAAAALLLALPLAWAVWQRQDRSRPEPQVPAIPLRSAVPGFPAGPLGSPDAGRACLAPGAELVVQAGGRVGIEGNRRIRAEAGIFWVEVDRGEPLGMDLPGAFLSLREGLLAVALPPSRKAGWLLGEAWAGEPSAVVSVLRGEAELKMPGADVRRLGSGRRLIVGFGDCREEALPEREMTSLQEARLQAIASIPGQEARGGLPGASSASPWRWVTVLSGREAHAEVGLTFGMDGGWYQWVPGMAALTPAPREFVEVLWDGERLTGRVNGVPCLREDPRRLKAVLRPGDREAWGVSVWGGAATVARSTLQQDAGR